MTADYDNTRGRYVGCVTPGMQVKAWDGQWHTVATATGPDRIGMFTLKFTDGGGTVLYLNTTVLTRNEE